MQNLKKKTQSTQLLNDLAGDGSYEEIKRLAEDGRWCVAAIKPAEEQSQQNTQ